MLGITKKGEENKTENFTLPWHEFTFQIHFEQCVQFWSHLKIDILEQDRVQKIARIVSTPKLWNDLHTSDSRKDLGFPS